MHLIQYIKDYNLFEDLLDKLENIDLLQSDNQGMTALQHAATSGNLKNYKKMRSFFKLPSAECKESKVKKTGPDELRIIYYAAKAPKKELLVYLIEKNEEKLVNKLDKNGRSPLHHAVLDKRLENVIFLCELEYVNIDLKDKFGKTPKDLAKELGESGEMIAKYLKNSLKNKQETKVIEILNVGSFSSLSHVNLKNQEITR